MNILVIDVGTSGMRGVIFDDSGKALDVRRMIYQVETPAPGIVEQDAVQWTAALVSICKGLSARWQIDAISLTSQRSSIIPVNKEGRPLAKAIMWQDSRNTGIVKEFEKYQEQIEAKTGAQLNTVFSGTKMTWLKRNRPKIYEEAYKICTVADYLVRFMAGEFVTDHTYGSRSLLMDIKSRAWDKGLLDLFEISEEKLCRLVAPGTIVGRVIPQFAEQSGVKEGIPVISSGGDQQCGALGQGVYRPESMEVTVGTGAYLLQYSKRAVYTAGSGIICGAHSMPGRYVLESSVLTCAALYNWANKVFFSSADFESMNAEIAHTKPGANGCVAIPYFQGRGTPDWNSQAQGAFAGVSLGTGRADMARAILESIAYEIQNSMDTFSGWNNRVTRIHLGGGLARQNIFCQILADITEKEVVRAEEFGEQTALGAWMSAAVAAGIYPDFRKAYEKATDGCTFMAYHPNEENFSVYKKGRERMNLLYQQLYQG